MSDEEFPDNNQMGSGNDSAVPSSEGSDPVEDIPPPGVPERRFPIREDRRKGQVSPPDGVERRMWADRRKLRSNEGRERYLDMVQKERVMLMDQGVSRSTEQLLDLAGAGGSSQNEEEGTRRDRATGDQLRASFAGSSMVTAVYSFDWFARRCAAHCAAA